MSFANTFDQLNEQASAIGYRVVVDAFQNKDLETIRAIRDDVVRLYDGLIKVVNEKLSYEAWHEYYIDISINNAFHKLDTSGEFTRLVDKLKLIDAEGYYFSTIKPLMLMDIKHVLDEREQILTTYEGIIQQIIADRRAAMHIVK